MKNNFYSILKQVQKPGRYSGGEYGQIIKDKEKIKARFIERYGIYTGVCDERITETESAEEVMNAIRRFYLQ